MVKSAGMVIDGYGIVIGLESVLCECDKIYAIFFITDSLSFIQRVELMEGKSVFN